MTKQVLCLSGKKTRWNKVHFDFLFKLHLVVPSIESLVLLLLLLGNKNCCKTFTFDIGHIMLASSSFGLGLVLMMMFAPGDEE